MTLRLRISALMIALAICSSCYEKKEGCLDVLASNFQLDADVDCCRKGEECCCTYPKLTISVKHQMEGQNLTSGSVYHTAKGQPFFVQAIQFLISDIQLLEGEEGYSISDNLEITSMTGDYFLVTDDITIMSTQAFSFSIGSFNRPGTYTALRFNVGITEPERSADPGQFPSGHPLHPGQPLLRDTTGNQLMYNVAWIPDTTSMDVVNLQAKAERAIEVLLPLSGSKGPGQSITIPVVIDYTRWLSQIDILDPVEVQNQKIMDGIAESFTIF